MSKPRQRNDACRTTILLSPSFSNRLGSSTFTTGATRSLQDSTTVCTHTHKACAAMQHRRGDHGLRASGASTRTSIAFRSVMMVLNCVSFSKPASMRNKPSRCG